MDSPELLRYSYSRGWQDGKIATSLDDNSGNWTKLMLYDGEMGMSDDHKERQHYAGVSRADLMPGGRGVGRYQILRFWQTWRGSFSAVSKRIFASKYSLESSRRDLHKALLCTVL